MVWLQQHLQSADPNVAVTASFDSPTDAAVRNLQAAHGLPVTGSTDAATWQVVLALPVQPVDWSSQ